MATGKTRAFTNNREMIIDMYPEETFLFVDGFDEAIIGVDTETMRIIYSVKKCIDLLMECGIPDVDEALEYFDYNARGAYMGEKTPIWCDDELIPEGEK
jgi:hypothetical protein